MRMVADAVVIEPVSASKFPDMRESAGNFCNLQGIWPCGPSKNTGLVRSYNQIPCALKQGIFL